MRQDADRRCRAVQRRRERDAGKSFSADETRYLCKAHLMMYFYSPSANNETDPSRRMSDGNGRLRAKSLQGSLSSSSADGILKDMHAICFLIDESLPRLHSVRNVLAAPRFICFAFDSKPPHSVRLALPTFLLPSRATPPETGVEGSDEGLLGGKCGEKKTCLFSLRIHFSIGACASRAPRNSIGNFGHEQARTRE